jgi:hypothetical protein
MRRLRFVLCGLVFTGAGIVSTQAQDKLNIDERLNASAVVIEEVMAAPDHAIPETVPGGAIDLTEPATCWCSVLYRGGKPRLLGS